MAIAMFHNAHDMPQRPTRQLCTLLVLKAWKTPKKVVPLGSSFRCKHCGCFHCSHCCKTNWHSPKLDNDRKCLVQEMFLFHSTKHDFSRKWVDPDGDQLADVWLGFDIFFNVSFTIELSLGITWSFASVGYWPGGRVWQTSVLSDLGLVVLKISHLRAM